MRSRPSSGLDGESVRVQKVRGWGSDGLRTFDHYYGAFDLLC